MRRLVTHGDLTEASVALATLAALALTILSLATR